MARSLTVLSSDLAAVTPLNLTHVTAAAALSALAVKLDPSNPDILRQAAEIATLTENTQVFDQLLKKRHDVEPKNDVLSLLTLEAYISTLNTADERIQAYETLLSEPARDNLTNPIASRLALDLALLHERVGDHEAYAKWLGEAVAMDPSHGGALYQASTFYREHSGDTIGTVEMILSMVRADPTDLPAQLLVGRLLLEHGAYRGAARIYDLAIESLTAQGVTLQDDFLSDAALAKWGGDNEDDVLQWLNDFDKTRESARSPGQELKITSLSPALNGIRLAIASHIGNELQKTNAARGVNDSFGQAITELKEAASKDEANADEQTLTAIVSQMQLEWAWLLLFTDSDLQQASSLIQALMDAGQLNQEATDRFAGWLALRSGKKAKALELFGKIAEHNELASYGISLINKDSGNSKAAAQGFLKVARGQAGSVVGVMAAYELWSLLGKRVPIDQRAERLDGLVQSLPKIIDRAPSDPTQLLTFRIRPAKTPIAPFEPPILEIEVANKTEFPLAIGEAEPLQPNVLLDVAVRTSYRKLERLTPIIIDIGRRLRLEPKEVLVVPVDLSVSPIGNVLQRIMSEGLTIETRGFTNFKVSEMNTGSRIEMIFRPGLLGSQASSPTLRIDGVVPTEKWLEDSIEIVQNPDDPRSLVMLALLGQLLDAEVVTAGGKLDELPAELIGRASKALAEGYKTQPSVAKGWLLSVFYNGKVGANLIQAASKSTDPMEQLGFLLNTWGERNSPQEATEVGVGRLVNSDDPTVAVVAEAIQQAILELNKNNAIRDN